MLMHTLAIRAKVVLQARVQYNLVPFVTEHGQTSTQSYRKMFN